MKKKIISAMLSIALVVTAVPSVPVSATETAVQFETAESETQESVENTESEAQTQEIMVNAESEVQTQEFIETVDSVEVLEAVETFETDVVYTEEALSEGYAVFNISDSGKAVGSNSIEYDNITYLSAGTVAALPSDVQQAYITFCDEIAAWNEAGNEIKDVVMAVDNDGSLQATFFIPNKEINEHKNELKERVINASENIEESVVEIIEETTEVETEEVTTEVETDVATEEATTEVETDDATEETTEVETDDVTEEETTEVTTEEETTEVATEVETEVETDDATEEETTEVATEVETDDATEVETTEVETEVITEEFEVQENVFNAENMELLAVVEEESFEVAEDVVADKIIDLGYDNADEINNLNSTLSNKNHFYNQLTSDEKVIYNAAYGNLTSGKNSFSYKARFVSEDKSLIDTLQAVSAVAMTKPDKCDWIDKSLDGGISGRYIYYRGNPIYNFEFTIAKSKHYNSTLVSESNNKIKELAAAAQDYALKNYPNSPVYGVVKYFDKWICENNFYSDAGLYPNFGDVKEFYYCHSSYGILLKGYGVCESYALAMTRLLDSLGIPNMYVCGDTPAGGHAWNYVKMPDGKWYLLDSTWNDPENTSATSTGDYLLCADDGMHKAVGNMYNGYRAPFKFAKLENKDYVANEEIDFNNKEYDLAAKETLQLTENISYKTTWKSSNTKVAKVSSKGKVTAVGPGTATITMKTAGISATCTVNVHRINNVTFDENNNKNSYSFTHGIPTGQFPKKTFSLTAQQIVGHKYTAEQFVKMQLCEAPTVTSSKEEVAIAEVKLLRDKLTLTVTPKDKGTTKITVNFAGKKATLNYTVKQQMSASWFSVEKFDGNNVDYTGKAYKPAVTISANAPADLKKSSFKVTHKNNKDAGVAQVIVSGKGNYGGDMVVYEYTIKPVNIRNADVILKNASKVYNGGEQNPTATVKVIVNGKTKTLSAKDISFVYSMNGRVSTAAKDVGIYSVRVVGKGNYTGEVNADKSFEIKPATIKKLSVKLTKSKLDYTGTAVYPGVTVKIGKNVIDATNYTITYRDSNNRNVIPKESGKYKVVITPKGKNIEATATKTEITKNFTIKKPGNK